MADSLHHDNGASEDGEDPKGQPDGETGAALPEVEPVVLGAAEAPVAGKGSPDPGWLLLGRKRARDGREAERSRWPTP